MPWILVRLQALEYALLHHSHIKNPKWTIPLSFIHLYYFQATFSRLDLSKEYTNYQLLLELKRDPRDPQPNAASEEMIEGACKTQWVWLLDLHELSQANFAGVTESNMRWLNMLFCGRFVQGLARGKQSTTHNMYQLICIHQESETHSDIQHINVCFIKSRDGRLQRKWVPPTAVLKRDRLEQAAEGPKPHGEAARFINFGSSWTPSFCCNCCSSCWHHSSRQLNHTESK